MYLNGGNHTNVLEKYLYAMEKLMAIWQAVFPLASELTFA